MDRAAPARACAALCGALVLLFAGSAPSSAQAACPNEQLRTEDSSLGLPDCRAYELVSPPAKNGGAVQGFGANFGGDVLQAALDGDSATFSSAASFGQAAQGAPPASQYLAHRVDGLGWSTRNLTIPTVSGSYGDEPNGVPYQLFSPDLVRGLLLNGAHCRGEGSGCPVANPPLPGSGAPPGYQNYYLRNDENAGFTALLTATPALGAEQFDLSFAGASPDLRHIVLSTCAALTPGASEVTSGGGGCEPAETNLYEWSDGALSLVNEAPSHHAQLAAQAGAISSDGQRIYFTEGEDSSILLREAGAPTKPLPETEAGAASFQTASADGSFAFFIKAGNLFRYGAGAQASTDIVPGGGVQGVLGAAEDGSYVYYSTSAGLFLWHSGATSAVAAVPGAADPGDYPPSTGSARVSPDGTHLAFLSQASLTGYDNSDASTGEPDSEVYLYSATANQLTCASCNPDGAPPAGPSTIPGAVANGKGAGATDSYKPRDLSADANRLFFDSRDALSAKDSNTHQDVYQWEAPGSGTCQQANGCIALISAGQSAADAQFIDASAEGSDAFFITDSSLVAQDPGSFDLYDARQGGGFPAPPISIECDGDSCQPLPFEPQDPAPGTAVPGDEGNPALRFTGTPHKKPHHRKHHHHRPARKRGARR